ncbi:hypothetical protein Sango_1900400 [Sesamum angolense]|uniref:Uncharacterized protein n=1 Tax=Sesamum angolense TaxID=2727404 RepID=A0AAE2BQQ3_9LAMI|nr:hypothetical protein Sango_1900400 [Sesamum angolense]
MVDNSKVEEYKNGVKTCVSNKDSHRYQIPSPTGKVEVTNRALVQGIKRSLERVGGNWIEKLTNILLAYRTTPEGFIGESYFTLVYGMEVIIPAELGVPSHRVLHFFEECNTGS